MIIYNVYKVVCGRFKLWWLCTLGNVCTLNITMLLNTLISEKCINISVFLIDFERPFYYNVNGKIFKRGIL